MYFKEKIKQLIYKIPIPFCEKKIRLNTINGQKNVIVLKNGFIIGESETNMIKSIVGQIKKGDIFYDVGAGYGKFSCIVPLLSEVSSVFAFDVNPACIGRIKSNTARFNSDVKIMNMALSNKSGVIDISMNVSEKESNIENMLSSGEGKKVKVDTVDNMVDNGFRPPDIIKIDVEGAEFDVIRGMKKIMRKNSCRSIFIETHPHKMKNFGSSEKDIKKMLVSMGYNISVLDVRKISRNSKIYEQKFINARRST